MVIKERWSLYRKTVYNDHLIKWSLCTGFLKKSACQFWHENYLGQSQTFSKFVEPSNKLTKLAEVGKHFTKFVNNFTTEVRRICKQLYKVCGTFQ